MGTKKKMIKNIIKNFDFDKVSEVMNCLNWVWVTNKTTWDSNIPTKDELIQTAKYCLKSAYKQAKENKIIDVTFICATGGFKASAVFGGSGKVDFLQLEFIITGWEETID